MSKDLEIEVNSLHSTLEALDHVRELFDECRSNEGLTKAALAKKIGRDPAYVSRVLNGRMSNVNYQTLARMILAMDQWPILNSEPIAQGVQMSNYCHRLDVVEDDSPGSLGSFWNVDVPSSENSKAEAGKAVRRITYGR